MSESTDETTSSRPQGGEAGRDWRSELGEQAELAPPGGDPDLVRLVQMTNAFGLDLEVVLTLPGQVLTGTLISGRTYFEGLATTVQGEHADDTMRGALAASYRKRSEDFEDWGAAGTLGELDPEGPDDDRLASLPKVAYLHLRYVEVAAPGSGRRLGLWRGRLSDVVGWSVDGAGEARPGA